MPADFYTRVLHNMYKNNSVLQYTHCVMCVLSITVHTLCNVCTVMSVLSITFHIVLDPKLSLYKFRSIIQIFNPAASLLKFGFFWIFSENIEKLQKNRNRLISHWD